MADVIRVSESSSLALHAALVLAGAGGRVSGRQIAARLGVSAAHLAKVLVRLEKAGLVRALRGPTGGYELGRPARAVSLLEVYEAAEGALRADHCLFRVPACNGRGCTLGGFFRGVSRGVIRKLGRTRLSDVRLTLKENHEEAQDNPH